MFVIILFVSFSSSLTSIKKRNAADWICNVATGKNRETRVLIRSYVPIYALVRPPVIIGSVIMLENLGKKVPIAIMNVFFARAFSLFITANTPQSDQSNYFF